MAAQKGRTKFRMLSYQVILKIQKPSSVDKDRIDHRDLAEIVTERRVISKFQQFCPLLYDGLRRIRTENSDKQRGIHIDQPLADQPGQIRHHQRMHIGRRMECRHRGQAQFLKGDPARNLREPLQHPAVGIQHRGKQSQLGDMKGIVHRRTIDLLRLCTEFLRNRTVHRKGPQIKHRKLQVYKLSAGAVFIGFLRGKKRMQPVPVFTCGKHAAVIESRPHTARHLGIGTKPAEIFGI